MNKQLPIHAYPQESILSSPSAETVAQVHRSLDKVDSETKRKAYQAWLGYHKAVMKKLLRDARGLVQMANEFAEAMGCPEPPMIEKKIVGKMGLKGVPGLRVGSVAGGRG